MLKQTNKQISKYSKIIADPTYFKAIISNHSVNYRTDLFHDLNKVFPPGIPYNTWKRRFLNPSSIPKYKLETYVFEMEKLLIFHGNKMVESISQQKEDYLSVINDMDKKIKKIKLNKTYYHAKIHDIEKTCSIINDAVELQKLQ